MTRIKKLKGFTLIELIVVVIIIGVLAAIAAVAYNQFVGNSRSTSIIATAKQVDKAIQAKTAMDDKTVATEGSSNITLANINVGSVDTLTFNATGPKVKVVDGTRSACLDYSSVAAGGPAASITYGTDTNVTC